MWAIQRKARDKDRRIVTPAPVVAQVWRNPGQAQVARVLKLSEIWPMDDRIARKAGILCGATETADVVDATVAILAAELSATVITSDLDDIAKLIDEQNASRRVEILVI